MAGKSKNQNEKRRQSALLRFYWRFSFLIGRGRFSVFSGFVAFLASRTDPRKNAEKVPEKCRKTAGKVPKKRRKSAEKAMVAIVAKVTISEKA